MKQTWRWFGPEDSIRIDDLLQVGVQGVVTALHGIAPGEVWSREAIVERQQLIAQRSDGRASGLAWDVIESLPVSEAIKTQSAECAAHLETYRQSLRNLHAAGLRTVCYNFMPVLDWTRTKLRARQPHGGTAMAFDLVDFAVFDLFLLERPGATDDYPADFVAQARVRLDGMGDAARRELVNNIVAGLPGANDGWTLSEVRAHLERYVGIDTERLRTHLIDFLSEVAPLAEELGMRLCCHPDDPPFSLLGLPRVMSSEADYRRVLDAVDLPANGATFCTGSLGVAAAFDAPGFIERLGHRICFAHLRNTRRDAPALGERTGFHEAEHLDGDTDMVSTIRALLGEERRRREQGRDDHEIPMRPDHGQDLLHDLDRSDAMPGYPLIGRMRGLAELRGVMAALG